jgi:DNA-binding GntR family transcriptional regulator
MVYQNNSSKSIFEELKLQILQGYFKPRERLLERSLAGRFGVSRTPVREALRKLESIGMIKIVHNQGAQVADFSLKDIDELLVVRINLERLGAKLALKCVTPKEIEHLREINAQLSRAVSLKNFPKMVEYDQLFHRYLTVLSKNEFLIKVIEELRAKAYPITYYIWKDLENVNESLADHKNIIDALRKRQEKKLLEAVELQLTKLKRYYLAAFPQ